MSKSIGIVIVAVLLIVLVAWSPWMTRSKAEARVVEHFSSAWEGVIDGCFICTGCGTKPAQRLIVGYSVDIEFVCGLESNHLMETAYVSPFGTVHGLNTP